jgi:hypothetical protein
LEEERGTNIVTFTDHIEVDGVSFVKADSIKWAGPIGPEVIIRTYSAGVHVGVLTEPWGDVNKPITLKNARRIWKWSGANTLNEISTNGLNRKTSRISEPVAELQLIPIEVIPIVAGVDLSAVWNG